MKNSLGMYGHIHIVSKTGVSTYHRKLDCVLQLKHIESLGLSCAGIMGDMPRREISNQQIDGVDMGHVFEDNTVEFRVLSLLEARLQHRINTDQTANLNFKTAES